MGDFYPAFSATCFVVLTLWMMMVQARSRPGKEIQSVRPFSLEPLVSGCFSRCPGS